MISPIKIYFIRSKLFQQKTFFLSTFLIFQSNQKSEICSGLLRGSVAKGSSTGLFHVDPTRVKACESFLFSEGSLIILVRKIVTLI